MNKILNIIEKYIFGNDIENVKDIILYSNTNKINDIVYTMKMLYLSNIDYIDYDNCHIVLVKNNMKINMKINIENKKINSIIFEPQIKILSVNMVIDFLNKTFSNYSFLYEYNDNKIEYNVNKRMAVASLVKIIVLNKILTLINNNKVNLKDEYLFCKEDLSLFSKGLSNSDTGKKIKVSELIKSMIILSDNSAMDILLKYINKFETLDIVPTKSLYSEAWPPNKINKYSNLLDVKWIYGYDYYYTLNDIYLNFKNIINKTNNPWGSLGLNIQYKGGEAPGVLSGIWNYNKKTIGLIINEEKYISFFEKIYIFDIINQLIKEC